MLRSRRRPVTRQLKHKSVTRHSANERRRRDLHSSPAASRKVWDQVLHVLLLGWVVSGAIWLVTVLIHTFVAQLEPTTVWHLGIRVTLLLCLAVLGVVASILYRLRPGLPHLVTSSLVSIGGVHRVTFGHVCMLCAVRHADRMPPNKPLHLSAAGFSRLGSLQLSRFVVACTLGRKWAAIR
jgi:hypothetical protein